MKGYFTFPRSPELEPHYQMQFSIMPRHRFWEEGVTPLQGKYNQCILSPTDKPWELIYSLSASILNALL